MKTVPQEISVKEIQRVTPSQFTVMSRCIYRVVLASSLDHDFVLPISANAYFGTLAHKILEKFEKGAITTIDEFEYAFSVQVNKIEKELEERGFHFMLPLSAHVKDFGVKKALLRRHLKRDQKSGVGGFHYITEKWYQSSDSSIGGKIDLVIVKGASVEIVDFKTGKIEEEIIGENGVPSLELKKEYTDQLKLYAYLYFEKTSVFPSSLALVDLVNRKYYVEFSESECRTIYEKAKLLLSETNERIRRNELNAIPSDDLCKFCLFRPGCSFFISYLERSEVQTDVVGIVTHVVRLLNRSVTVFLNRNGTSIRVNRLLIDFKERKIAFFNLKKAQASSDYSATKMTLYYGY
jgi:ethanolamine utilization protein EutP (predicted NTPase)